MMKVSRTFRFLVIMVVVFFGYAWWTTNQSRLYQNEYGPNLREEFGFSHGSPYVMAGDEMTEVFTIYPAVDGYLYEVGFREGEIITSESITGFYKLLYHSRGEAISVDLVKGGEGPPISERETRALEFIVPNRVIDE